MEHVAEQASPPPHKDFLPFRFSAGTAAYYRLWLSNMLLTIVTLGIYSAWAKVRMQKFLLGHTEFAGGRFDYHGQPLTILKGRILMLLVLVLWQLSASSAPLYTVFGLVLFLCMPWLIAQALRFRLANTSWNRMRLRFSGSNKAAYLAYLKYWTLLTVSVGLAWPWAVLIKRRFITEHTHLGQTRLKQHDCIGSLYAGMLSAIAYSALYAALMFIVLGVVWLLASNAGLDFKLPQEGVPPLDLTALLGLFGYLITIWSSMNLLNSLQRRAMLKHTTLELAGKSHRIEWRVSSGQLARLHLGNTLAMLLSLGLAWPWVHLRTLRLQLQPLALYGNSDFSTLHTDLQAPYDSSASGDELADMVGVDLGW